MSPPAPLLAEASIRWRPWLHFTAPRGWLNDPNGLVRVGDTWHLHYQYEWPRQWGHATSHDLFHWEHLPVALRPDDNGDCWSGGTVHDVDNTSGLFAGPAGGFVSIYTSQDAVHGQRISLACSDDGRTWRKAPGNPILRRAQRDCRDPKVFWHEARARWVMVLTESVHLTFFVSANLRDWRETGRFTPQPEPGVDGVECPDLFPLPVTNRPGVTKWVLTASYLSGDNFVGDRGFGACAQRYYVGEFDGDTFRAENGERVLLPLGQGPDEYAAIVWPRETGGMRRTLLIGWMNHWGYAKRIPTGDWQGCLTLPRELSLQEVAPGEWRLRFAPARELWAWPHTTTVFSAKRLGQKDDALALGGLRCGAIRAVLQPGAAAVVEFAVLAAGCARAVVGYDVARQVLYYDRRHSGSPEFHPNFLARFETALVIAANEPLALLIVVDRSTVEVFAQDGAVYLAGLTFPGSANASAHLAVIAGEAEIVRLEANVFAAPSPASRLA